MRAVQTLVPALRVSAALATLGMMTGSVLPRALAQKAAAPPASQTPAAAKTDSQTSLFLTPGGRYTKADIKANGGKTVGQKYPNFMAEHDTKPKRGVRICPITKTKANPKLTWVVGGKTYQFCCPPCVAEFVAKAKKDPKSIKAPEA